MQKNIPFLLILLCALSACRNSDSVATQNPQSSGKPNILWIVAEDISPYLAAYGDSTAKTPNIDRLVREGVRYTNFFDVSGVCAPSRSSIITGMYPTSIGTDNMRTVHVVPGAGIPNHSVVLPPQIKMFSELMRKGGYYCTNNDKQDYQFVAPRSGWDESSKSAHWRNRPEGKPFFAVFNLGVTHESQIWAKKNDPLLVNPDSVPLPPYYPDSPIIRKDVARMYSNIMEMDTQVGQLLKQLEEDGLLEKTIVFWYSDNGGPLPRGKREIYDTGIHVPLVIRFPDKKYAGDVNNDLVSFVDLAPTVLSLAGLPLPAYLQGYAFLGYAKATTPRKYVYAARDRMDSEYDIVRAVRDDRYKYIRNFQPEKPYIQDIAYRKQMDLMNELLRYEKEGKLNDIQKLWFRKTKTPEELYDTKADPFELHDLSGDPAYAGQLKRLSSELDRWISFTADKGFIPEKEWIQSFWPDFVQPATQPPVFLGDGLVTIASPTPGASISWQIIGQDGKADEKHWNLYTQAIKLSKGETLAAVAERIGYKSSEIKTFKLDDSN
jgi:arylsulfatase A-like enzyme